MARLKTKNSCRAFATYLACLICAAGFIVACTLPFVWLLFWSEAILADRLIIALMAGVSTFVAALILFTRDRARHFSTLRVVRKNLLARDDIHEQEFLAHFQEADSQLIAQIRLAIGKYFDVPPQKILANDSIPDDLQIGKLEPDFHSFVLCQIFHFRNIEPKRFTFNTASLAHIGGLYKEIQRILGGMDSPKPMGHDAV